MSKRPSIEVRNVTKKFVEGKVKVDVIDNVSFNVHQDEFVCILGPSGCGKSTLLRMLAGLEFPDSGEIIFNGRRIKSPNPKMAAMIFQTFALLPWRTVYENIELGLDVLEMTKAKRDEVIKRHIHRMQLDGFENAYPYEISGGMKQRVGIARALAMDPDVLLMDEPFSSLDALTADTLRKDVLEAWRLKSVKPDTVVMVTHLIDEAVFMADRVIVLSKRPARVIGDIKINIPRPREKHMRHKEFYMVSDKIRKMIG